ncbi:unnamed protein product [marine sediment metagenome]|uniref:Uncharacterized protein n=1 Tax=marine sediment metagenome TaxID=412755 RepID=X1BSN5_9ZZZZ
MLKLKLKSKNEEGVLSDLKNLIEQVLNGDLSLNNAIKMLNHINS